MDTFLYTNAAQATNDAIKDAENKQYLSSWAKTMPARVNYLADSVVNAALAPINLLKACFGALKAAFTWGYETKDLTNALKEFNGNINHSLSSFAGIFLTKKGIDLRSSKNLEFLLVSAIGISSVAFLIFTIRADMAGFRYNNFSSSFEPSFFWYSN